jgi:hypothetical protein
MEFLDKNVNKSHTIKIEKMKLGNNLNKNITYSIDHEAYTNK